MIPSSVRIFVCTEPQDMRRSFDGLALATQQVLGEDPQSGALFVRDRATHAGQRPLMSRRRCALERSGAQRCGGRRAASSSASRQGMSAS